MTAALGGLILAVMKPTRRTLHERQNLGEATAKSSVDGNIVRDVVLLGLGSKNGRVYEAAAVIDAVKRGLYEGTHIYVDHVTATEDAAREGVRTFRDLIGVAQKTRFTADQKVVADIHVFGSDPMGAKFLEAAANPVFAAAVGMSHDAIGDVEERDGVTYVVKIHDIQSADAVTRPATTKSLFESARVPMRLSEMQRARFRAAADGDEEEGEIVGELVQVKNAAGEIMTLPKELVTPIDDEPAAEAEAKPEDDKMTAKESVRLRAAESENKRLRAKVAIGDTRDMLARKTERMSPAMGRVVREHFSGRIAAVGEVDAFIAVAQKVTEANAVDSEGEADGEPVLSLSGWSAPAETNTNNGAALLRSAFGMEG